MVICYNKLLVRVIISDKYVVFIQSLLITIIGASLILRPLFVFVGEHLRNTRLERVDPLGISPNLVLTLVGIVLVYLAPYLYRRRELAYQLSITLTLGVLIMLMTHRHFLAATFIIVLGTVTVIYLFFSHRLYKVKSDMIRLRFGAKTAVIAAGVGYAYGVLGFLLLDHAAFHQTFSFQQSLQLAFQVLFTLHYIEVPTMQAELFVHSIDVISGLILVLVATSLFKPVRFALGSQKKDWDLARDILRTTSRSSEDYFKLWPQDKRYFFSPSHRSFLAYKTSGGTAIILGDPSGDLSEFNKLIVNFRDFTASNGWRIAIINATEYSRELLKSSGFNEQFVGNKAIVSIPHFITHTSHSKRFRYVINKAERDGLSVEYLPSLNDEQFRMLKDVSDAWLSQGGRREYTFFMGYFEKSYLQASGVVLLKQHDKVVAYINIVPSFVDDEVAIDHLRSLPDASPVAMRFLLLNLMKILHEAGKKAVDIGIAPLSGVELADNQNSVNDRILALLKKFGNRYYSFKGVEHFKGKLDPIWYPSYLYYMGNKAVLSLVARDIERAASRQFSTRTSKRRGVTIIIVVTLLIVALQLV